MIIWMIKFTKLIFKQKKELIEELETLKEKLKTKIELLEAANLNYESLKEQKEFYFTPQEKEQLKELCELLALPIISIIDDILSYKNNERQILAEVLNNCILDIKDFKSKIQILKTLEKEKETLEKDNKDLINVVSQLDAKLMPFLPVKDLQMWKTANGGDKLIKMNYFEKAIKQMEAICSDYSNQKALFQFLRMATSQLMDEVKARDFILCVFTALGYADNIPKLEQDFTEHKIAKNLEVRKKHDVSIF